MAASLLHHREQGVRRTADLTYKQFAEGRAITPAYSNLHIVRKDLDLDRALIVQFVELAKRFFAGV
jgi:hypothetical protein